MNATSPARRGSPVLVGLTLAALVLIQVGLLNFLPTPWAVPQVVVVAVLALAVTRGPVTGALAGAWAGFLLDVVPPALGPLGGWMLVLTVLAAAAGSVADIARPGPVAAMVLVATGSGLAVLGWAAVLWFAGAPAAGMVLGSALAAMLWGLLLAPGALLLASRAEAVHGRTRASSGRTADRGRMSAGGRR